MTNGECFMAYDILKSKWYEFDIQKMMSALRTDKKLDPLTDHLNNWEKYLIKVDTMLNRDIRRNQLNIALYYQQKEIFQFPYCFNDSQKFIFQFNINSLTEYLNQYYSGKYLTLKTDLFKTVYENNPNAQIIYAKEDVGEEYIIDKPIIIVPLYDNDSEGIVVDGNHRISAYKKYNITTIKAQKFLPMDVRFFGTPLDRAIYVFINELQAFGYYLSDGWSVPDLLKQSLLPKLDV